MAYKTKICLNIEVEVKGNHPDGIDKDRIEFRGAGIKVIEITQNVIEVEKIKPKTSPNLIALNESKRFIKEMLKENPEFDEYKIAGRTTHENESIVELRTDKLKNIQYWDSRSTAVQFAIKDGCIYIGLSSFRYCNQYCSSFMCKVELAKLDSIDLVIAITSAIINEKFYVQDINKAKVANKVKVARFMNKEFNKYMVDEEIAEW